MFKFSSEALRAHIKSDNAESLVIYNDLKNAYESSLKIYPKNINIMGVYFFNILKLLTISYFKYKEIKLGIQPKNLESHKKLNHWPYIGYQDIKEGIDLRSKSFGAISPINPRILQRMLQKVINSQYYLGRHFSHTISVISPRIAYGENILSIQSPKLKTNLITTGEGWFSVPALNDQLELLGKAVAEVMEKNDHPLSPLSIVEILLSHIKADCKEGPIDFEFNSDILLLGSGVDLQNRMLSMTALNKGMKIINIQHGEAFGIYDEPNFGDLGEGAYANAFLGFGDSALAYKDTYKHGLSKSIDYIKSNGTNVKKLYRPEFKGVNSKIEKINFYYFPTTLSGSSHRYGPYRDTADYLYLSWQDLLIEFFNGKLNIKVHPKEKYSIDQNFNSINRVSGSINDLHEKIDVFVFDYIGTAFNEACATDKPIIYFDLGIRNTASNVLESIKNRTIYFNLDDGMPLMSDIEELIHFDAIDNRYSLKYSLCGNNNSRSRSLSDGIAEIYG